MDTRFTRLTTFFQSTLSAMMTTAAVLSVLRTLRVNTARAGATGLAAQTPSASQHRSAQQRRGSTAAGRKGGGDEKSEKGAPFLAGVMGTTPVPKLRRRITLRCGSGAGRAVSPR
jgi:hypothetical protein